MVDARVGVLGLQGDYAEHLAVLTSCGYRTADVRSVEELDACDALVIPGGESTTMLKLMDRYELREPVGKRISAGMPVFGTCAGAIVLAKQSSDGEPPLGLLDIDVDRNAYGRQVESFESEVHVALDGPTTVEGVFIRAPVITRTGRGVEVLARHAGDPVLVRQGSMVACTFHPELSGDVGIHRWFVEKVCAD